MKLRNQLLTLSLATLLVPWFGWKLVQELERFLRAGQETALLASARTVARALPAEYQSTLIFGRDRIVQLRELSAPPHLDGYDDDWIEPGKVSRFSSVDGALELTRFLQFFNQDTQSHVEPKGFAQVIGKVLSDFGNIGQERRHFAFE